MLLLKSLNDLHQSLFEWHRLVSSTLRHTSTCSMYQHHHTTHHATLRTKLKFKELNASALCPTPVFRSIHAQPPIGVIGNYNCEMEITFWLPQAETALGQLS